MEHDDQISGRIFDRRILQRILPFARPHLMLFFGATALLFILFAVEVSIPSLWRHLVDGLGDEHRANAAGATSTLERGIAAVLPYAALYFGAVLFINILRYMQEICLARGGQEVIYDLRKAVFSHLLRQPLPFYDRQSVGRLTTRVTNDVENVSELFTSGLATVAYDVLKSSASRRFFARDWRLGCVAVGLAPLLAIVSLWFRGHAREGFREVRSWLGKSNGFLQEAIAGIRVIQVFGREAKVARKFETITTGYLAANVKTVFFFALFFPLVESSIALDQSGVLLTGGFGIESGRITRGMFLEFWFYLEFLFTPLRELGEKYNVLQSAMASAERIFKLLDEKPAIESPPNALKPEKIRGAIELRNVSFSYDGKTPVLKHLQLAAAPGETLALVGATGAGKTTVASLLGRFYDVTDGTVFVDGHDVRTLDLDALRTSIGFVPQDLFLFAGTIFENVALHRAGVTRDAVKHALHAVGAVPFVERLAPIGTAPERALDAGLDAPVAERGVTFSVGERQLLAFARALAGDPAMVILDEATANVDTETEHRIQDGIRALLRGRTALVIAHRLSTIREATRIAVLHKGELREIGSHDELIRKGGLYATLVMLQFGEEALGGNAARLAAATARPA